MNDGQRVRDLGEFGLIDALRDALPTGVRSGGRLTIGIGDDAALWLPEPHEEVIITTDALVEGVHFRLDWTDWERLGHKALAVNLSDIAAMGGRASLATVTLGLTGNERVEDLVAFYRGLGALAERWGCLIAGGDMVRSPQVTIGITALGQTRHDRTLTRSGARVGDQIGVSGTLGASAAGLALLRLPESDPRRLATTADQLVMTHLRPQPRLDLAPFLLDARATSAMDLSDGLFGDLPKILKASNVAGRIDASALPVAAAVKALFQDDWLEMATRGGEDYELLFTAPKERMRAAQVAAREIGATITVIGEVVAATGRAQLAMVGLDGTEAPVEERAYDHFRQE